MNTNADRDLIAAVQNGDLEGAKKAITDGANVNVTNDRKETALIIAASKFSYDLVQLLVESGAELDNTDKDGNSARGIIGRIRAMRMGASNWTNNKEDEYLRIRSYLSQKGAKLIQNNQVHEV